jgi:hypothetical protein
MRSLEMPGELQDRTREIWRPLWAIADTAGGESPGRSRQAAAVLHSIQRQELDHRVLPLADIRDIFDAAQTDRIHTKATLAALVQVEDHLWTGWWLDSSTGEVTTRAA